MTDEAEGESSLSSAMREARMHDALDVRASGAGAERASTREAERARRALQAKLRARRLERGLAELSI